MEKPDEFICRETYPGSPPTGTIVLRHNNALFREKLNKEVPQQHLKFYANNIIELSPRHWEKITMHEVPITIGAYFVVKGEVFLNRIIKITDRSNITYMRQTLYGPAQSMRERTAIFIERVTEEGWQEFETIDEAEECLLQTLELFSLNDIAEVYRSAKNSNYEQYEQLRTILNNKLS